MRGFLQLRCQLLHVPIAVAKALRLRQAYAVDDARMVQFIRDDGIALIQNRLEQPAIGVKTRAVQDRIRHPEKFAQPAFQLLVNLLRPADEAHRCQPVTPAFKRLPRGLNNLRMVRQTQIVVGAQIQDALLCAQINVCILRARENALGFVQPRFSNLAQLIFVSCLNGFKHPALLSVFANRLTPAATRASPKSLCRFRLTSWPQNLFRIHSTETGA